MDNSNYTYIDLNMSFLRHPGTDDVVKRYDVAAIKTAVRNILATNKGEKLFLPEFGADLRGLLFELITPATKILARKKIVEEIQRWEPRVIVTSVVIDTTDVFGTLTITVEYSLAERPQVTDNVAITLRRVR